MVGTGRYQFLSDLKPRQYQCSLAIICSLFNFFFLIDMFPVFHVDKKQSLFFYDGGQRYGNGLLYGTCLEIDRNERSSQEMPRIVKLENYWNIKGRAIQKFSV